jgi:hypothetical protein
VPLIERLREAVWAAIMRLRAEQPPQDEPALAEDQAEKVF